MGLIDMPELAYVNGAFVELSEARVSVEDRGYQFADGVYEVIGTYNGQPFALDEHLVRLQHSLDELCIKLNVSDYGIGKRVSVGIKLAGFEETLVYVQVTRGVAPRRHEFPSSQTQPSIVMTFKPLERLSQNIFKTGVEVVSLPDLRWKRCDIKSTALLANVLAKQEAAKQGAFEALLVDTDGYITEGSSTSVFWVNRGRLCTTPSGEHILPSITRKILWEVATELQLETRQYSCSLEDLLQADEVILAGTTTEALSVIRIDSKPIGKGIPGPISRKLRIAFLKHC